ncbi:MAG: GAF domain-containing protein [Candidatus Rokubacteria bacterium]|nr:GAF domain-containing protein [Candidatus Rokubacteria bacterium]
MLIHKLLPLVALGLNLLLLGSALAPDRKSHRNLLFAYLAAGLAVWNLGVFGLRWTSNPDTAVAWEYFLHLGVIPIPVLFYHYVLAFLDLPRRRPALLGGYALCGAFLLASPTPYFLRGVTESAWGFMPAAGPLYAPFVVYFQSYLVLGLVRLVRAYRSQSSSFKRNRTLLVILGVVVSLLGGIVDFVRFIFRWDWLYPVGIPSNAVFALALGVAIVRYHLMDIGTLAKRTVLYLLTSAALAPILFVGLWALDELLVGRAPATGVGTLMRDALILLLVFTVALPVLRELEGGLERLMFRRRHGVRDALVALQRELGSLLEIGALGRTLTQGLVARVPVLHASLHLHDAAAGFVPFAHAASEAAEASARSPALDTALTLWLQATARTLIVEETTFHGATHDRMRPAIARLERERVALLVPLFLEREVAGVLVIGEKLSGEIFDSEEIGLLEMLAGQAAIALKNSGLYEDLRARMEELRQTQDTLVQSAKLAAIGELAASVAHEINNPLMVILGHSGLLLREAAPDSPEHRRLSGIVTEANRAGKIVRDLLDFARRREPNRGPVSVHELLELVLALLHAKLAHAGVEVERVFDASLPAILADRDQLIQVFLNLITNAVDAMEGGGVLVLETGTRQDDDDRTLITVSVSDTGPGIPPEHLARIFEPFYTTKPEGRGTGLGLSVSLGIVRMHGGAIDVDSKPDRGTTMRVTLPVR